MHCFSVIRSVLDELYAQIEGTDDRKDEAINERIEYLSNAYKSLSRPDRPPIDYKDPVTRFAYIYKYVTSHADIVCQLIDQTPQLGSLFQNDWTDVTCVGGGPGSDFLGVLKYMMQLNMKGTLKCYLYDGEQAWNDSWSDVDKKVQGCKFRISTSFQPFDVTNPATWQSHRKCLQADLFTMVYFLSEVYRVKADAQPFFDNLISAARSGALFLFVDNKSSHFYGWFDEMVTSHGLQVLASRNGTMGLGWDENKSELGPYLEKFSSPKLRTEVAYRICVKQ